MKRVVLALLTGYKSFSKTRETIFGTILGPQYAECRFSPTCSVYTYQAVEKYGVLKGIRMGIARILRCNPWSKGGFDPVK